MTASRACKLLFSGFALLLSTATVDAGCASKVAHCVHTDAKHETAYNGLCVARFCSTVQYISRFLRFPDGQRLRVDFPDDPVSPKLNVTVTSPSGTLEKSVSATGEAAIQEGPLTILRTDDGEFYITIDCFRDCRTMDEATYLKLQDFL